MRRLLFASILLWETAALAGPPIGPNGSPINTSNYTIDMYQGVANVGTRPLGMGAAYVAIAEDTDGNLQNAATPALRAFFSVDHFDYWLGFGVTVPTGVKDYFNSQGNNPNCVSNCVSLSDILYLTPAVNLQFGPVGIGATFEILTYGATRHGGSIDVGSQGQASVFIPVTHLQAAYAFSQNQFILGVGARLAAFHLRASSPTSVDTTAFSSVGQGLELGAIWKPARQQFRFGASVRSPINTDPIYSDALLPNSAGDIVVGTPDKPTYLPQGISLPWDLNFGFAFQVGRPFNPPWRDVDDVVEHDRLQYRLRSLDRAAARDRELAKATNEVDRGLIVARYADQQKQDDEKMEEIVQDARWRQKEIEAKWPRRYFLLTTAVLVSGAVDNAVGVESFISQTVNRAGQDVVASPRFGFETEIVPDFFKVRSGMYLEPSRFDTSQGRIHWTVGLDLKLGVWDVFGAWPADYLWRLGLGGDFTERYQSIGFTFGGWYPRHSGKVTRKD